MASWNLERRHAMCALDARGRAVKATSSRETGGRRSGEFADEGEDSFFDGWERVVGAAEWDVGHVPVFDPVGGVRELALHHRVMLGAVEGDDAGA